MIAENLLVFVGIWQFSLGDATLLGAKECTFGPSYWCGSLRNAKQCNAIDHCIQTVWEKQILPADNDNVCIICKDMIKEARDQLLSNETQEEIREVFEGSCKLIPVEIIRDECIQVSDEYIPDLIDTLASQMNPQIVCATVGLCNSARVDRMMAEAKKTPTQKQPEKPEMEPSTKDCKDCKNFIADLVTDVRKRPKTEVLERLLAICGRLGSLSDGCMSLVQSNFISIYEFITTGLQPNDFCDFIGMCERMYGKQLTVLPRTGDEPCDFCVAIVNGWRNNLFANTTKEEFRTILEGLCQHTGNFKTECLSLVDQYFETLYDILISDIDAKEICSAFGLCGPNGLFKQEVPVWTIFGMKPEDHLPLIPLEPAIDFTGMDEANSYRSNVHLPRVTLVKEAIKVVSLHENGLLMKEGRKSNECVMCEFVLHFLQNVLNEKNTRAEVKDALDKVCGAFPRSVAEQCQDYVDAYGDQLVQLLILEIDPSSICPMLHICPVASVGSSVSDTPCVLCEFVMVQLDQILSDKNNEEEIKRAVESVCSLLPKSINSQCKLFIETYIDQIVDLLVHDFTPKQICAQLGICPENGKKAIVIDPDLYQLPISRFFLPNLSEFGDAVSSSSQDLPLKQSATCVICEFIMAKIDSVLLQNATEAEIKKIVNKVCLWLPNTLKNDCLDFMEEYDESLIEMLVNSLQPGYVCREVKLCKNAVNQGLWKAGVSLPADKCLVCEEAVRWMDQHVNDKRIVDLVDSVLDKVCSILPETSKTECYKMVTKYGQFMINLLEELSDPKRVCQAIRMCPYLGGKPLLGAERCTWGPSYWCQSYMHAEACQASKHCEEKVWITSIPAF